MFLKRSAGFLVYFIVILIAKVHFEITSDGLDIDDFTVILPYSIVSMLIISLFLQMIELVVSFFKNQDLKFWKYFNFYGSLLVLLISLIIVFSLYSIIPAFDSKSLVLWGVIILIGEATRIYYNKQILKGI